MGRRSFNVNFEQAAPTRPNPFSNFNPSFTTGLTFNYMQPLLRGFFIDNPRQQLLITQINRDISEESVRATVTQTLANVRNAYWDLVFARNSVDVAQRALQLADKLVEDNGRASKSARSHRSTSCRPKPKRRTAARRWPLPKPRSRPRSSRSSATS